MNTVAAVPSHPTGWSIILGVVLILVGLLAIGFPFFAGIAASIYFGWLVLFAGVAHFIYAWSERGAGAIVWQTLIGLVYCIAAVYMILHPLESVPALTLVLAIYIAIEGVFELFYRLRRHAGTSWFLIDGIVSLLLAALIFFHWPSSSGWALGTLVGISLLFSGIARFTMPVRRRRRMLLPI
jgi:uncharacterized membrane protein HdeD (DUF308 family)